MYVQRAREIVVFLKTLQDMREHYVAMHIIKAIMGDDECQVRKWGHFFFC